MSRNSVPTPKKLRLRKGIVACTLPPGALRLVDGLVGTFIGGTRSEVLRFIVQSWVVTHHAEINQIGAAEYVRQARKLRARDRA